MAIGTDFSVDTSGNIRHVSGSTTYTVLEFHRWLSDLADDAVAVDNDFVDITADTPSERSTDNIISLLGSYNIDDTAAQYLYDGSISQSGGDVLYSGLVVVGSVYSTTTLQIIQNNTLYGGASPFWGTDLNADSTQNILMRCMIKTRTGSSDVDGKRIRVQAREFGYTYAEFSVTMGLGNSVAAIFTNQDLNNTTADTTVSGWTGITNVTEGYNLIDLNNGAGDKPYYSEWDRSSYSINQLYERAKYLTRRGEDTLQLYGLDGEMFRGITHEIVVNNPTGTFNAYEPVSWAGATPGTGQMLAINSTTAATKMWIQLLTGSTPSNGVTITGGSSSATADVNVTVTSRTVSNCFLGQSTGSAIIGAYGIGIEATDLTSSDKLFDLNNAQQIPPNLVTFTLAGIVSGEDRVLVGPKDTGNAFDFDQLALATTLSGVAETEVVVTTAIPSDTPSAGTIRVASDAGIYNRLEYASWSTSTFTLASGIDFSSDTTTSGNNVLISYIDKLADDTEATFQAIYSTDRSLYIRVRDGGGTPIKTFESPSSIGSAGGSATAIRTSDA